MLACASIWLRLSHCNANRIAEPLIAAIYNFPSHSIAVIICPIHQARVLCFNFNINAAHTIHFHMHSHLIRWFFVVASAPTLSCMEHIFNRAPRFVKNHQSIEDAICALVRIRILFLFSSAIIRIAHIIQRLAAVGDGGIEKENGKKILKC